MSARASRQPRLARAALAALIALLGACSSAGPPRAPQPDAVASAAWQLDQTLLVARVLEAAGTRSSDGCAGRSLDPRSPDGQRLGQALALARHIQDLQQHHVQVRAAGSAATAALVQQHQNLRLGEAQTADVARARAQLMDTVDEELAVARALQAATLQLNALLGLPPQATPELADLLPLKSPDESDRDCGARVPSPGSES